MQQAQLYYDLPTIFVSLIAIGVLGLIMDRIVMAADRVLTAWQENYDDENLVSKRIEEF